MGKRFRLWFGWLIAVVLAVGIYDLKEELRVDLARTDVAYEAGEAAQPLTDRFLQIEIPRDGVEEEAPAQRSTGCYVYATLSGECQRVYDEVYGAILDNAESVRVSTLDNEVLEEAYKAMTADHGEIFWVSGYAYTRYTQGDEVKGLDFSPNYTKTPAERALLQEQVDARAEEILGEIPREASDYEKVKTVFCYLASEVDYRTGAPENQNILSALLYGETVCQGYASAMQYLLARLGIQAAVVTGEADGTPHAWDLVRMDGEYYYIDPTWGNSCYSDGEGGARFVDYSYFGLTTEDLEKTHVPNDSFVLPECTARRDNYYVREGRYFDEWDAGALGALCASGYETGDATVSVRFSDSALRQYAVDYLISELHISDYCEGLTSFYYLEDEGQNVLTLRFP